MLVIDRKHQEKVKIFHNDEEMIIIVAIENGKVKLVFDAPRSFSIWRLELLEDGIRPQRNGNDKWQIVPSQGNVDSKPSSVGVDISQNGGPYDGE